MNHQILTCGHLLLVRERGDAETPETNKRAGNGLLLNPPGLYVVYWDERQCTFQVDPISFGAAEVLSKSDFNWLMKQLGSARDSEWQAFSERRRERINEGK